MSSMLKQKLIDIANGFTKYGLWKGGTEITVDSELSTTSTNPVQNKVITSELNKQDKMTVDSELSTTSTNPVQNKVITRNINVMTENLSRKTTVMYKDYSFTFLANTTSDESFSINIYQKGYRPIAYSIICGYSTHPSLRYGVENFTDSLIQGFYQNSLNANVNPIFRIAYLKINV